VSKPSVLINLANLRSGGGLQAGASFLDELVRLAGSSDSRRWRWFPHDVVVEASREVVHNAILDVSPIAVRVLEGGPLASMRRAISGGRGHDVVFTLFGPDYAPRRGKRLVVGFADVTSLYPEAAHLPSTAGARARWAARRRVSRASYHRADRIVVESPHLVDDLTHRWGVAAAMTVVPNVVNGEVLTRGDVAPRMDLAGAHDAEVLFFPTRAYAHKNLAFLGRVGAVLMERHRLPVRFLLTLDSVEWSALPEATKAFSVNVGPLRVTDLEAHYRACTAVFFPSLLEAQSVTPLEALALEVPLLACDRPFVRSTVGDAAWYFDPEDPVSAADAVKQMLTEHTERDRKRELGRVLMASWPRASDRAVSYLDVIDSELARVGVPAH
jgi:glycosyltransferase involved in cell wall biosynthesis